jgi:hypothetical protein
MVRQARYGLADGNDLTRFGEGRGNDTVGIRLEVGIAELIARKVERAPGAFEPRFRFVLRRLLAVEVGHRCVAARLQGGGALVIR